MKPLLAILAALAVGGCAQRLQVEPVTVKPIHVVVDVNVHDSADTATARPADAGK
ncbi:MAG: hypothetical protein AB7T06_01130 [Kofleriaceae bacterium]